ncbi:microtubule-associated serine/threonine-protein kinase 2-like isoform X2 [Bolinopsis microptera]|uniref:microtubule-associated serine/threonine-protein kinase 2-like isoform X2 n=1 Tax=Bolinopsis microptera TaxID=2820187 RepID=UPI003079F892
MDSKLTRWSSLAEFLQSEKLSEYIPTFSTLDLKAFSKLTFKDIQSQVSPIYDRHRIVDAVNFAKACLDPDTSMDTDPLRKLTPTNAQVADDVMKTPTKSSFNKMKTSTPSKRYLATALKSALRPTKSLSPPVKQRGIPERKSLSSYEHSLAPYESEGSDGDTDPDTTGLGEEEGSNLVRLRRNLGSSDPSLSTADKSGENAELVGYHRSRSNRRATEYRLSSGEFSPCHSPCPSPRALSPNRPPTLPNLVNLNYYNTHRRWSVASSASDYYSGSPSSLSSASSQERLYVPGYRVSDEDVSHIQLQRQHSQDAAKNRPRPRARSLSPERQPESNLANETSFNIYKDRFPQAKDEMEKDLQNFLEESHTRSEGIVKGEANANFIHHRVSELAKDILEHSKEERITDTYFEEVSTTLMRLISDSERTAADMLSGTHTGGLVTKEASELLKIISRSARLLECLTFSVGSFYSKIQEGTIDELLRSTASLPRYISSRLSTKFGVIESEDPTSPATSQPSHTPHPSSSGTEDEAQERSQFNEEDFENRKLISNGAYGEVFLVKHVESKELFALKRIRKDRVIERNEVQRAFMERDILSFMQNPFVVSMLCSFQTKTHLCMVLEYVEGGDVGTLLKNMGGLDIDLARMYHAETLLALEYIHSYGIVHRDLKPENLLITKEGHIKLTDFGLSKCGLMQMATRQFENSMAAFDDDVGCIGTPDYIAPEVFYSRQYGFSVDWWSMGIILYQFLVGCTPFRGETIEALVENINPRNIEWPGPDDDPVEEEAKDLILGLLFMNPSERLGAQGAQEVKKHPFYQTLHWDELIMHKAEFVPYLDSEEDTSYFDSRDDMYDHSITEDCLPSVEDNSHHIKYFDSVNWSSADQFIALNSPRHRHLSHDSIDSGTDNQPSLSTDDGHSSSGEQNTSFHTSSPRERCFSDSILRKPIKEEPGPSRQTKTPDPPLTTPKPLQPDNKTLKTLLVPKASSTPTKPANRVSPGSKCSADLYRNLCTPVKVKPGYTLPSS